MTKLRATSRSLDKADEQVDKGPVHIDVIRLGDLKVKRQTHPPGWRFSTDMGQAQCYDTHVGYAISGHLHVRLGDGQELDVRGGDVFVIPPGHDAWTIGDEDTVLVQFDEGASALERFGVEAPAKAAA
jgi:mannose-6-phosphate isomerase-like protein (cupin superfamily)